MNPELFLSSRLGNRQIPVSSTASSKVYIFDEPFEVFFGIDSSAKKKVKLIFLLTPEKLFYYRNFSLLFFFYNIIFHDQCQF